MDADEPMWIREHGLVVGEHVVTKDSDLVLEYLGHAQVRDRNGFRYVMVFRDARSTLPLLTLNEEDAGLSAGFTQLGDHLANDVDPPGVVGEDDELRMVLRAVLAAEDTDDPADNQAVATALSWDLGKVASVLAMAKDRMFVWGQRGPRLPGPWFSDLDVTVQGKRFLRS